MMLSGIAFAFVEDDDGRDNNDVVFLLHVGALRMSILATSQSLSLSIHSTLFCALKAALNSTTQIPDSQMSDSQPLQQPQMQWPIRAQIIQLQEFSFLFSLSIFSSILHVLLDLCHVLRGHDRLSD